MGVTLSQSEGQTEIKAYPNCKPVHIEVFDVSVSDSSSLTSQGHLKVKLDDIFSYPDMYRPKN